MHGVPPVKWSSAVAKSAQEWANKGKYEHSLSYNVPSPAGPAGENLALGHETIAQANWAWYNEVKDCVEFPGCRGPKGQGKNGAAIGHFTALIWRGVKEIGCGTSKVDGRDMYVCRYRSGPKKDCNTPNMGGCYKQNVPKKVKTKAQCLIDEPAAPAGQPGAPRPTATGCKFQDTTKGQEPHSIKTYKQVTYKSRCEWVKKTGRCSVCVKGKTKPGLCNSSFMVPYYRKKCSATCKGEGKDSYPSDKK